ncbi:uncharacterized protein LOC142530176 [Primulina tabacum]|uniref:uncharacterized protein LOC142530176 n=1 Tax=Primulina tabacum TaxID=48773 RepID=UPI003F59D326
MSSASTNTDVRAAQQSSNPTSDGLRMEQRVQEQIVNGTNDVVVDSLEQLTVPIVNHSLNNSTKGVDGLSDNIKKPAKTIPTNMNTRTGTPVMNSKKDRVSYASLFKNNRTANEDYKLEFVDTGSDKLKFGFNDIDSIEDTYGICLLGYVISGKPPTVALFDLVRRWGSDVKFQAHETGWIVFTFPNVEAKERILCGGAYMVFGFHLFLKEMPRCFRFREKDMNTVPSWVQIHGLPPDCWNFNILSKLAFRLGTPIHMDMLTHQRKRVRYASVD